jgi:hypothetical protein
MKEDNRKENLKDKYSGVRRRQIESDVEKFLYGGGKILKVEGRTNEEWFASYKENLSRIAEMGLE